MRVDVQMNVRVRVRFAIGMNVPMDVNQIGLFQQGCLTQNFRGRSRRHHPAGLKDETLIGDVLHDSKIVGAGDDGLRAARRPSSTSHQQKL